MTVTWLSHDCHMTTSHDRFTWQNLMTVSNDKNHMTVTWQYHMTISHDNITWQCNMQYHIMTWSHDSHMTISHDGKITWPGHRLVDILPQCLDPCLHEALSGSVKCQHGCTLSWKWYHLTVRSRMQNNHTGLSVIFVAFCTHLTSYNLF